MSARTKSYALAAVFGALAILRVFLRFDSPIALITTGLLAAAAMLHAYRGYATTPSAPES